MRKYLLSFFHEKSWGNRPNVPQDSSLWPEAWKKIHYKTYPRTPVVALPDPTEVTVLNLKQLSALLAHACGLQKIPDRENHRTYPSGGGLYPVEIYVSSGDVQGLARGLYHYAHQTHTLEHIGQEHHQKQFVDAMTYEFTKDAPCTIVLSARWGISSPKYGDFAYRIIMMEAGHISENLQLVAESLGLRYCSFAGFKQKQANESFDLTSRSEDIIYCTSIGTSQQVVQ